MDDWDYDDYQWCEELGLLAPSFQELFKDGLTDKFQEEDFYYWLNDQGWLY